MSIGPGTHLGQYVVKQQIGQGAMGTVFLAERGARPHRAFHGHASAGPRRLAKLMQGSSIKSDADTETRVMEGLGVGVGRGLGVAMGVGLGLGRGRGDAPALGTE